MNEPRGREHDIGLDKVTSSFTILFCILRGDSSIIKEERELGGEKGGA